jgi:hypothetical protein
LTWQNKLLWGKSVVQSNGIGGFHEGLHCDTASVGKFRSDDDAVVDVNCVTLGVHFQTENIRRAEKDWCEILKALFKNPADSGIDKLFS